MTGLLVDVLEVHVVEVVIRAATHAMAVIATDAIDDKKNKKPVF
jgi:hypothetical protein